jgi:cysteine desulfurase/selenocysteine lyase
VKALQELKSASASWAPAAASFDVTRIRRDFPILCQRVHGKPLVYLDNAATTQKPQSVIDALTHYYTTDNSNVHRGLHQLSERATEAYEGAREKVRRFINAGDTREIIFVRGATEGINLVAESYGRRNVGAGDEILITGMEHHSNIVPWQILCEEKGARLRVAPINDAGELLIEDFERLLTAKTKLVSLPHVSNALGTVNPVRRLVEMAHCRNIPVLIDGAQAAPHLKIDVREIDCDFYTFSSHKVFGPTGMGVLYGKESFLDKMPPYQGGGDMILSVTFEKTIYNALPYKFEAGTPHIAGAIGLGAAIDYLEQVGIQAIMAYENELLAYASAKVSAIEGVRMIGTAKEKAGVISFVMGCAHAHDVGTILDQEGVAIRTGHHCAMPTMDRFGVPATARASLAFYNTKDEIDALVHAIHKVREVFV